MLLMFFVFFILFVDENIHYTEQEIIEQFLSMSWSGQFMVSWCSDDVSV